MLKYYYNGVFRELYKVQENYSYRTGNTSFQITEDWRSSTLFPISKEDFTKSIKKIKKNPVEGSYLYFDGTSKFPRFKLQNSNFKRCIKIEKADQVVVNQTIIDNLGITNTANYIIVEENDQLCLINKNISPYIKQNGESTLDAINRISNLFPSKKIIYEGKCPLIVEGSSAINLVINVIDNVYDNIIYDNDLDAVINKKLESLDQETVNSILEMLESKDLSIVSMGLKLLPNYNVLEYPSTVNTMLRLNNYRITQSSIWNSTAVKQLCSSINYSLPSIESFPGCLHGVFNTDSTFSDEDKKLTKSLILSKVKKVIDEIYNSELKDICEQYNIKFYAEAS